MKLTAAHLLTSTVSPSGKVSSSCRQCSQSMARVDLEVEILPSQREHDSRIPFWWSATCYPYRRGSFKVFDYILAEKCWQRRANLWLSRM